jgi:zinc D-Ala-D-Ala dipeptidase
LLPCSAGFYASALLRASRRVPPIPLLAVFVMITPVNHTARKKTRSFAPYVLALYLLASAPILFAQTATAPSTFLLHGPKPADAPAEWKQLVGVYENYPARGFGQELIIFEKDQHLFLQPTAAPTNTQEVYEAGGSLMITESDGRTYAFSEHRNERGAVTQLNYRENWGEGGNVNSFPYLRGLNRIDAGNDATPFFHITPTKPVAQLRVAALADRPPAEPGPFRKPDLVELAPLDPAIHLDIRYAQSNNFLSTPVYTQARAFLQRPAAEALVRVLHKLEPLGYGLLIHDAYRPWYVTKIFWDATPPENHNFVANPADGSRHNRGCAVDLTLYDLATGKPVEMTGLYDEMSPRSFPNFPGGTSLQRWHRDLLRRAMESEGFTVFEDEWWHFDYKDWREYPILNVPFEKLAGASPHS